MALVMTLITLSILMILLIGFLSGSLLERRAAGSFEDTQRAKLIAQGAVSHAVDILRTNIPDPARLGEGPTTAVGKNWVTNPGRLTLIENGVDAIDKTTYVPLHTGEVISMPDPSRPRDAESVDLNQPLPGQTVPAITGTAGGVGAARPPMRVKWVNLLRDPSEEASKDNRLTGRYAFWMDDETSRLNFNTALGKPNDVEEPDFKKQLDKGFMPPLFTRGDAATLNTGTTSRNWGLGKPQSVNLDILFDQPAQLQHDKLLGHVFLQGYARYPEAILDFISVPSAKDWYDKNKFNLTFYNRSPEFNAFGRSRLYTTYFPLSLEGGPSSQLPFIYDPNSSSGTITPRSPEGALKLGTLKSGLLKDNQILSLNSLMGFFGASADIAGPGGYLGDQANMINRNQIEMLMSYMRRKWPGYDKSFVDKYGEIGCYQIALNMVQMARQATTQIDNTDIAAFSTAYGARTTSVIFMPNSTELSGYAPERFYWRIKDPATQKVVLMLPQMPGPHITEVRLFAQAVNAKVSKLPPPSSPAITDDSYFISYWYEIEYYMHPFGPVVDLEKFPTRMDYLDVAAGPDVGAMTNSQQFGPTNGDDTRADKQWQNENMKLLATMPPANTVLGPDGATFPGKTVRNRITVTSPKFYLGKGATTVTTKTTAGDYKNWEPVVFDAKIIKTPSVKIRFRPGMGILSAENRPRQMIPLGETQADTLEGIFKLDAALGDEQVISWQINDPRLSSNKDQWIAQGPGSAGDIGTPGERNSLRSSNPQVPPTSVEPEETSDEKSKFRYIERTPEDSKIAGFKYDRPDEYNTASRVSSPGYWSMLHTGMQGNGGGNPVPWRTLNFTEGANVQQSPPDWLLLDLFGATYPMAHDQWKINNTLPDAFSTASYMNSTAGQVNLNSRIYPQTDYFKPPERRQPIEAVFKYLGSDGDIANFAEQVSAYQGNQKFFDYVGRITEVSGYQNRGNTPWEKEAFLRNMAGCLTTRSNTFGVWGVSQVVKKLPSNTDYGNFQRGDHVTAEKRFYALVERYVWPGRDGVPGNGHLNSSGKWDRLAKQVKDITNAQGVTDTLYSLPGSPPLERTGSERLDLDSTGTYPAFDGPEPVGMDVYTAAALGKVTYARTKLEEAYNPPQAVVKYRVVYFKYLDQ